MDASAGGPPVERLRRKLTSSLVRYGAKVLRQAFLWYFSIRLRGIEHVPRDGGAIIAGNHPSTIDGLLLYLLCPVPLQFIAHRELFRHPLTRWIMRSCGFINAGRKREALRLAEGALREGCVVVVFPEGGPYDRGQMEELHQGVAVLALKTGAPVVPLGIAGAAEAYPLGSYLPRPAPILLQFGRPVAFARVPEGEPVSDDAVVATLLEIRASIVTLRDRAGRHCEALRRRRMGWGRIARIVMAALVLLPINASVTFLAHDLEPPYSENTVARQR